MLSRIFWISVAGIALIAGMAVQGDSIFGWGDRVHSDRHRERAIEARVERAIEGGFEEMHVVGSDGREVDVPAKTKQAMAKAVGELVKAEAHLAVTRIGDDDDDDEELQAAQARRDRARAEIDRLKVEMKEFERAAQGDNDALREQIRREIREDVRASVREAVRN
jgi:hypothetical protein